MALDLTVPVLPVFELPTVLVCLPLGGVCVPEGRTSAETLLASSRHEVFAGLELLVSKV